MPACQSQSLKDKHGYNIYVVRCTKKQTRCSHACPWSSGTRKQALQPLSMHIQLGHSWCTVSLLTSSLFRQGGIHISSECSLNIMMQLQSQSGLPSCSCILRRVNQLERSRPIHLHLLHPQHLHQTLKRGVTI